MRGHCQRAIPHRADRLPQRRVSLCVRAALLGVMVPMFAAELASATTITVDSLIDATPAVDGACTLREAIINANDDAGDGDCAAGSSEDTIVFSTPGTVTLSSELPTLSDTERTTIDGDIGANGNIDIIVSGNNAVRVFRIASDAVVTLSWLTIGDGSTSGFGGGVRNGGDLLITHSTVSGNTADGYGGGIFNSYIGSLRVDHSTVADNVAGNRGGGIDQNGTAVVVNSTFYGNHASDGGAISAWAGSLTISHSTLVGNSADGLGGGMYVYSPVAFFHSIIASNTAANCASAGSGALTDVSSSLQYGDTSCGAAIPFGDPLLGLLQDNGGPTFTMLPGAGSPAIYAVACDPAVTDDQRGAPRPHGPACDIGAVEVGPMPIVVTSLADTVVVDGMCSLREAIGNANGDDQSGSVDCGSGMGEDRIRFQVPGTITLGSELPGLIDTDRTTIDGDISGQANSDIIVSGNSSTRLFRVGAGASVKMTHLSLVDGLVDVDPADDGGAIYNRGTLILSHCTVSGNSASNYGGAIYNYFSYGSTLTIDNCTFSSNHAGATGGAIDNNSTLTVTNSTFYNNTADAPGGAINAYRGNVEIRNSSLSGNNASSGGAIYIHESYLTVTVANSVFVGNGGGNCGHQGTTGLTDAGGNLRWPATDSSCVGTLANPMLGPLQDNGGPTWTMLPGDDSAAIDAGICDPAVAYDQRGIARPQGVACDIGAVEVVVEVDRIFANGFD